MAQAHRSLRTLAAALAAAVLLSGCPAPSQRPEPPSNPLPGPQPSGPLTPIPPPAPRAPPSPRENHLSPATLSLVTQSRTLASHGDLDGASSTLDRALRIEPNNPLLWMELGRLRLLESDGHQAEGCARKQLGAATGD